MHSGIFFFIFLAHYDQSAFLFANQYEISQNILSSKENGSKKKFSKLKVWAAFEKMSFLMVNRVFWLILDKDLDVQFSVFFYVNNV